MDNTDLKIQKNSKIKLSPKAQFALVMILPAFLLFVIFVLLPVLDSVYTSFTNYSGTTLTKKLIGIQNYKFILRDEIFYKSLVNDVVITLGKEVVILVTSLFTAVALTQMKFSKAECGFYRFIYFIPNVLSMIIIGVLWSFVLNPSIGLVNGFLNAVGLNNFTHAWLGEYATVKPAIIVIASWAGFGFFMLIFIAAINDVPTELYESANIDGASSWKRFLFITIPSIWSQIQLAFITILFTSLVGNLAIVMPITRGGPDNASMVMSYYMYKLGINDHRVGYANAVAVILLVITAGLSFLSLKLSNKEE